MINSNFLSLQDIPNLKSDKVSVTLYYEALCGGCHEWITQELVSTYEKLGKYMDFEFVPYGNAHVRFLKKWINYLRLLWISINNLSFCIMKYEKASLLFYLIIISNNQMETAGSFSVNMDHKSALEISNNHVS